MINNRTIIFIPSRINSKRLFRKPLLNINGYPMIIHMAKLAYKSKLGRSIVVTDSNTIKKIVEKYGFEVIKTYKKHICGSDRIYEAFCNIENNKYNIIVNLQGDIPNISKENIHYAIDILNKTKADISTLCTKIIFKKDKINENIVKVIGTNLNKYLLRAIYFTRLSAPYGSGPMYKHIGIYAFRRESLENFVKANPSPLEKREKLEQLRAIENNMKIYVGIINNNPISIDTEDNLNEIRKILL